MTGRLLGIYGAGGCGRSIMPFAREHFRRAHADAQSNRVVFIDDHSATTHVNGHDILRFAEFLALPADVRYVTVAVASPSVRALISTRCAEAGVQAWTAISSSAVLMDDISLGAGAALSPFVTIGSNVRIGEHFHASLYSYVEHDCVVGDFVTLAPGVKCNGNVHIGDGAYVGAGSVIRQGTTDAPMKIGEGAIIGMGAVVLSHVPPGAVVVGNPARRIR